MDVSILIPARNEMWLGKTVGDLLAHSETDIEILIGLDGDPSCCPIPEDKRVTVVHYPKSIGQRAITNQLCKIATAPYVAKVDAHCSFARGWDKHMLQGFNDNGDNIVQVPIMRNLHAFDWICPKGHRRYQGPSGVCKECGQPTERDVLWIGKEKPQSTTYRFDREMHFQYFNEYKKHPDYKATLSTGYTESMSLQGSFFMLSRDLYWKLNICDEEYGSWGAQGTEVACKAWLSGGRVVVNHSTWYAHLFRTQGGDFSFPYEQDNDQVARARKRSQEMFLDNRWHLQKRPLSWLIDRFAPVTDWHDEAGKGMLERVRAWGKRFDSRGIVYYTDNRLDNTPIGDRVRQSLLDTGLPITSVSLKPIPFGNNIVVDGERGYLTMFKQILMGLEAANEDVIFLCEHDVLYHNSHFAFVPDDQKVFYNQNTWMLRANDGFSVYYDCKRVSGICADRKLLIQHYRERVRRVEAEGFTRRMGFEPGTHNRAERVDDLKSEVYRSEVPIIDIRHDRNLTDSRWSPEQFRDKRNCQNWKEGYEIPGWGDSRNIL